MPLSKNGMKVCSKCKESFPATTAHFYKSTAYSDGLRSHCKRCVAKEFKSYQQSHPEKEREKGRRYRQKHAEELRQRAQRPEQKAVRQVWVDNNREHVYRRQRDRRSVLRAEMLHAYGWQCSCCGETEERFLTLEHTRRDGAVHKRAVGSGCSIWRDLRRRGWPQDGSYTLLCWNCNCATANGDPCPHVLSKRNAA